MSAKSEMQQTTTEDTLRDQLTTYKGTHSANVSHKVHATIGDMRLKQRTGYQPMDAPDVSDNLQPYLDAKTHLLSINRCSLCQ